MAYDYLGLVNDVNRRLNEVELTTSNFINATGEYSMIKDAVNSAKKKKSIKSDKFEANPTLDSQIQKVDNT